MNEERVQGGDAEMRMALRGLRQDIDPGRDLWPGIAARLQSQPLQRPQHVHKSRPGWLWPVALAASVVMAVGVAWQVKPLTPPTEVMPRVAQTSRPASAMTLVQREADSMTVHYDAALRELAPQVLPAGWQTGLDALDRSAIEIRTAMHQDPNSRLLLERLRATYTRRLVLARRALYA